MRAFAHFKSLGNALFILMTLSAVVTAAAAEDGGTFVCAQEHASRNVVATRWNQKAQSLGVCTTSSTPNDFLSTVKVAIFDQ